MAALPPLWSSPWGETVGYASMPLSENAVESDMDVPRLTIKTRPTIKKLKLNWTTSHGANSL